MKNLLYTLLWFGCSISISIVYRLAGHYFHFNGLITSLSLLLQGLSVVLYTRQLPVIPNPKNLLFVGTVVSQSFYILFSNLSLQYVPIYIAIIFKCFVPIFNVFINGTNIKSTILNSIVLSFGMFLSIYDSTQKIIVYSYLGIIFCTLACLFNVVRFSIIKKYIDTLQDNKTLSVISDTYWIMSILILPISIVNLDTNWTLETLEYFSLITFSCTFLGLFLTIGELKVLQYNTVFFTTILEVLKEVILLVGSGMLENDLDLFNWVGIGLVITSILSIHFENLPLEENLELE